MVDKIQVASPSRLPCGGTPYEDVAKVLRPYTMIGPATVIAMDLADLFSYNNPDFNRERFMTACGLKSEG